MDPAAAARVSQQQVVLHGDLERLADWCERNPDVSGGYWLDNSAAEAGTGLVEMVLAVTDADAADSLPDLEHPRQLRVVTVPRTEAWLRQVRDELVRQAVPDVSGIGLDIVNNRVRLYVDGEESPAVETVRGQYGDDAVHIVYGRVVVRLR